VSTEDESGHRIEQFIAHAAKVAAARASGDRLWARLQRPGQGVVFLCPCCFMPTLAERGVGDICPVCFWEDDGQDDPHADEIWGGSNDGFSLAQARANFAANLTMYAPGNDNFAWFRGGEPEMAAMRRLIETARRLRAEAGAAGAAGLWTRFDADLALLTDHHLTAPLG
jgi:hypothetical protein